MSKVLQEVELSSPLIMSRGRPWGQLKIHVAWALCLLVVVLYVMETSFERYSSPIVSSLSNIRENTMSDRDLQWTPGCFRSVMLAFDWDGYIRAINDVSSDGSTPEEAELAKAYQLNLTRLLTPFIELEPRVWVNTTCKAPPLENPPPEYECQHVSSNAFQGSLLSTPRKIGILVQFGFGVDVLEIFLNEVFDVVDQFFIIESTRAHFRTLSKALMWERVKDQARFRKFASKITHFILDDAGVAGTSIEFVNSTDNLGSVSWKMEYLQEEMRWTKFLQWNSANGLFSSDDLIGFGDADEIPSRSTIQRLRYCHLAAEQIDVGIWFPYGRIDQAFSSDFPVLGQVYTLGDPTFWTLNAATSYSNSGKYPGRMRGSSGHYVLGGIHMTHYGYLPYQLIRDLTCTECGFGPGHGNFGGTADSLRNVYEKLQRKELRELEEQFGATPNQFRYRIQRLESLRGQIEEIAILPWFYNCNRKRYPVWEGGHDTRLD